LLELLLVRSGRPLRRGAGLRFSRVVEQLHRVLQLLDPPRQLTDLTLKAIDAQR
jgi:hypothetical protein